MRAVKAAADDAIVDGEKEWAPPLCLANCEMVLVIRFVFLPALQKDMQQRRARGEKGGRACDGCASPFLPIFVSSKQGARVRLGGLGPRARANVKTIEASSLQGPGQAKKKPHSFSRQKIWLNPPLRSIARRAGWMEMVTVYTFGTSLGSGSSRVCLMTIDPRHHSLDAGRTFWQLL